MALRCGCECTLAANQREKGLRGKSWPASKIFCPNYASFSLSQTRDPPRKTTFKPRWMSCKLYLKDLLPLLRAKMPPASTESSGSILLHHLPKRVLHLIMMIWICRKLGYKSVLARGWGSFDNFACSFSALYCIGGIRVLFYIALSNGGPAAMYADLHLKPWRNILLTNFKKMEFLDIGKYLVNYHFRHACGGLLYLPSRRVHLLLGLPVLGRWKAWEVRLFLGSGLDPGGLDRLSRRRFFRCCQLSRV